MKQKFEHYAQLVSSYAHRLSDPRFVGQIVFVVIVLLVSYSGVKSIQSNYSLQKQIGSLRQQNELQQLQNENAALKNNYYNSKQYLELSARQNFGLASPGEKEILVPESVAATYVTGLPDAPQSSVIAEAPVIQQTNVQAWINFFLHRG
jgi:cell division protein FtsB